MLPQLQAIRTDKSSTPILGRTGPQGAATASRGPSEDVPESEPRAGAPDACSALAKLAAPRDCAGVEDEAPDQGEDDAEDDDLEGSDEGLTDS